MANEIIKYNPFYSLLQDDNSDKFFDDEPPEYIENIQEMSKILENCKCYTTKDFCDLKESIKKQHCTVNGTSMFSTYFENIDGNQSNFDKFSAKMSIFNHDFSVIGLAETNVDKINKDLYNLSNYTSEFSSKIEEKSKGSGIALYVKNDFNFSVVEEFSFCNTNIESLFIKLTNAAAPITVCIIYRPPNGNLTEYNKEFELLISKLPEQNCYILGDFNVDLHNLKTKSELTYEEIIISNGFLPVVSIATNHKSGCKKSCIDNIISNQCPQNIVASGKFSSAMSSHSGIFQISVNIGCVKNTTDEKI